MNEDPSGYLTLNATWVGIILDIAFTALGSWMKIGYDIIGMGLKVYAKRKGFTLFYNKLMYGAVPKIRGFFGKALTIFRKAIWRVAGNIANNLTTWFFNSALNKLVTGFNEWTKTENLKKFWNIAFRLTSLGSAIALILDWCTDGNPHNNKIRF